MTIQKNKTTRSVIITRVLIVGALVICLIGGMSFASNAIIRNITRQVSNEMDLIKAEKEWDALKERKQRPSRLDLRDDGN